MYWPRELYQDIVIYDLIVWGYEAECIVPEPATWLLRVLGLGGLAAKRRTAVIRGIEPGNSKRPTAGAS